MSEGAQFILFCALQRMDAGVPSTTQIGGSRARAATSDCYAARAAFRSVRRPAGYFRPATGAPRRGSCVRTRQFRAAVWLARHIDLISPAGAQAAAGTRPDHRAGELARRRGRLRQRRPRSARCVPYADRGAAKIWHTGQGTGFPLLTLAPGGMRSSVPLRERPAGSSETTRPARSPANGARPATHQAAT